MKHINKFSGNYCAGEVMMILSNRKRACRFNYYEPRQYLRDQLDFFSKNISDNISRLDENYEDQSEEEDDIEIRSEEESDNEFTRQPINVLSVNLRNSHMHLLVKTTLTFVKTKQQKVREIFMC